MNPLVILFFLSFPLFFSLNDSNAHEIRLSSCQKNGVRPIVLFLPGGPGFNANPERLLLFPYLKSLGLNPISIDEPSQLRTTNLPYSSENAFRNYLVNAKTSFLKIIHQQKLLLESHQCGKNSKITVTLVAHSFGVHAAVYLAKKYPRNLKKIILFSPGLNIADSDRNILTLAANGLASLGDTENSEKIFQLLKDMGPQFDQKKGEAFTLAAKYQLLFTHYWSSTEKMAKYFSHVTGSFAFDPVSFFDVRQTMPLVKLTPKEKISIPTMIYFGEHDPVISRPKEIPYLKNYFRHPRIKIIKNSKHYTHIEFPESIRWR